MNNAVTVLCLLRTNRSELNDINITFLEIIKCVIIKLLVFNTMIACH